MKKMKIYLQVITLFLFSCSGTTNQEEQNDETPEMLMLYTDWTESIALTHLAKFLLERDLDIEVTLKLTDIETIFNDIAAGDADVFVDAWLPSTHSRYFAKYQGSVVDLGYNYLEARTGLVVPDYMDVESIEDLKNHYTGPIIGIDTTAGIMRNANRVISFYNLENELIISSDLEMSTKLEHAVNRREDIVITGWKPHWIFHRFDLKYLRDPKSVFNQSERIHTIARIGFDEDHPDATEFLQRMILTEKQINSLLFQMKLQPDPLVAIENWVEENEIVVNKWTRGLGPEREKVM
ncbi:MAG: glycine betaine ABC transporter substrate-binding protein [Bacteroidota bacterium]